jgi:universal stress protein E
MRKLMPIRKILVAVKRLDANSLPAVLKAAQIARAFGSEVELFHALSEPVYLDLYQADQIGGGRLENQLLTAAKRKLEAIADRLRVHSIRVKVSVGWDFPVYEAIVRQALKSKADLIVVQRYGAKHTAPALMQLTDWELVKISPVPLLLVKNPRPYRHPSVLAAVDPSHRFGKTLELDRSILRASSALSQGLGGKLHAVHAYHALPLFGISPTATVDLIDTMVRQARRAASARFERTLRTVRITKSRRYLVPARPVEAIAEMASRHRIAIVVMGALSRSGLSRLLIGNTAERILDELTCDILVIKPSSFRSSISPIQRGALLRVVSAANMMGYY